MYNIEIEIENDKKGNRVSWSFFMEEKESKDLFDSSHTEDLNVVPQSFCFERKIELNISEGNYTNLKQSTLDIIEKKFNNYLELVKEHFKDFEAKNKVMIEDKKYDFYNN